MLQALLVKFLFLTQQFGNKLNVDRQLRYDVAYRREWCERAGLGFELGELGYNQGAPILTTAPVPACPFPLSLWPLGTTGPRRSQEKGRNPVG